MPSNSAAMSMSRIDIQLRDATAYQIQGNPGKDDYKAKDEKVLRGRLGLRSRYEKPEHFTRRRRDLAHLVIVEPRNFVEHPDQKKLCGEGCDSEVESLDPEAWQPEQHADCRRATA